MAPRSLTLTLCYIRSLETISANRVSIRGIREGGRPGLLGGVLPMQLMVRIMFAAHPGWVARAQRQC
jgi:hypothetical protein